MTNEQERKAAEPAWKEWYDAQVIKPFPYHQGFKCFAAGYRAALASQAQPVAWHPTGDVVMRADAGEFSPQRLFTPADAFYTAQDVLGSQVVQECDRLPARVLAMCKARGWSLHWTHRGAYLHLESSELIEALRGKRGDPLGEAADVLLVLMSITESNGLPWEAVLAQCVRTVEKLEAAPRYKGEEFTAAPVAAGEPHTEGVPVVVCPHGIHMDNACGACNPPRGTSGVALPDSVPFPPSPAADPQPDSSYPALPEGQEVTARQPSEAARDVIRELLARHAALVDAGNEHAYFELAYTRVTGWMAWLTDKPARGEPGTAEYAQSRKVIARGQGDTPDEACADAVYAMDAAINEALQEPT